MIMKTIRTIPALVAILEAFSFFEAVGIKTPSRLQIMLRRV
jgi:hypothetical protein